MRPCLLLLTGLCLAAEPTLAELTPAAALGPGLVLHLGAVDGSLAAALARAHPVVVLAVSADRAREDAVRARLAAAGVHGQATVAGFAGRVPLIDDAAALTVADLDALPGLDEAEALRVTRPFGRLLLRQGGRWRSIDKPRPAGADDWGQYHYDATMSDRSADRLAGPARGIQWISGPQNSTSDGVRIAGALALYQDAGRALVARDAFSGLVLWRRPDLVPLTRFTLMADRERIYIHPVGSDRMPAPAMLALDARSGETIRSYDEGITFVPPAGGWKRDDKDPQRQELQLRSRDLQARLTADGRLLQVAGRQMVLLDAASGRRLWSAEAAEDAVWGHPIVSGDAVYVVEGPWAQSWSYTHWPMVGIQRVHRLDLASGKPRWTYAAPAAREPLAAYNQSVGAGRLALVCRSRLAAKGELCALILAADDGRETAYVPRPFPDKRGGGMVIGGGHSGARGAIIGDRLHVTTIGQVIGSLPVNDPQGAVERPYAALTRPVGCTVFRSAGDWIFGSLTVYSLTGTEVQHTNAARTACDVGAFPANGLSYITTNHCFCLPYLPGSMAFHPRPFAGEERLERLETGPARPAQRPLLTSANEAWPMFLANNQRGAWVDDPLPPTLQPIWQARPAGAAAPPASIAAAWADHWYAQGPVSQASAAHGLVVVGVAHRQQIVAYDAATGAERWRTSVDGRVDCAPTIAGGMVVAGTRNGWIYALDLADGRPAWRFFAAPRRDRIIVDGQPESVWPCFGSVNVTDDGVWALAGRHGDSDGGLWWWRLDLVSGAARAQGRIGRAELHRDTTMTGILAQPPVLDRGLFQIPGKTLRIADGALQEWTSTYQPQSGRWNEWDGWYERFERGVLTPGNQGVLARVEILFGYKLGQYGLASGRLFAFKDDEFAAVGGAASPQHRGGSNDSVLRRMRRLPAITTIEVPDAKDPARLQKRQVGNRVLWEQGNLGLWRGDGLGAIAMAGDALLVGGEVTNADRWKERQAMPFRLRVLRQDSGEQRQDDLALPAKPLVGGIISDDGRVFVVTADGTLSAFGAASR